MKKKITPELFTYWYFMAAKRNAKSAYYLKLIKEQIAKLEIYINE